MTWIGQEVMKTSKSVNRTRRESRITQTDSRRDNGLFSVQELKKNGVEHKRTSPKESGTDQQKW